MLKLKLYILIENKVGAVIPIQLGQVISFGRTKRANTCFENDGSMGSLHFEIEHKGHSAEIRDLGSPGGTWLNHRHIAVSELYDGDIIRAGKTQFRVSLEDPNAEKIEFRPV